MRRIRLKLVCRGIFSPVYSTTLRRGGMAASANTPRRSIAEEPTRNGNAAKRESIIIVDTPAGYTPSVRKMGKDASGYPPRYSPLPATFLSLARNVDVFEVVFQVGLRGALHRNVFLRLNSTAQLRTLLDRLRCLLRSH